MSYKKDICPNCRNKIIDKYNRTKRVRLKLKMFHKAVEVPQFNETIVFDVFHSTNVKELDVHDWALCEFCGSLWKDGKKIIFLKKNCFDCEGSIIEKDYEYFFEKIIYNSV